VVYGLTGGREVGYRATVHQGRCVVHVVIRDNQHDSVVTVHTVQYDVWLLVL
jgi:hypothetical protein